ncbi:MAG TPA: lytic transglycosylase domain-containing protein [Acidimicrobiales bacterium]|nr:lytic transglycosylase domain-containing protein [Acidimicrobiales bacterium]
MLADNAAGVTDQLVAAERAVRDPATAAEALPGWAHLQQVAYRKLGVTPEWDAEVLARVPPELQDTVSLNLEARRELRQLVTTVRDTVPAWRIIDPPPADVLISAYRVAEAEFRVPWEYLAAVNLVESAMGQIRGTSDAGAQGPMQFLPATWAAYGEGDINDPHDAIRAAARYLAHNGAADGNLPGALYAYNHSDHYVAGVTAIAHVIEADATAFRGYYHWQVYYLTTVGDVWLPVGYQATEPTPVSEYLSAHPQ